MAGDGAQAADALPAFVAAGVRGCCSLPGLRSVPGREVSFGPGKSEGPRLGLGGRSRGRWPGPRTPPAAERGGRDPRGRGSVAAQECGAGDSRLGLRPVEPHPHAHPLGLAGVRAVKCSFLPIFQRKYQASGMVIPK